MPDLLKLDTVGSSIEDDWNRIQQVPEWAMKLFNLFCPDHLYEEIEADLIQKFFLE